MSKPAMNAKRFSCWGFLILFTTIPFFGFSQEDSLRNAYNDHPFEDSVNVPRKSEWQQWAYERSYYRFPAAKKNNWSVGINGGLAMTSSDVKARLSWGVGANVRKALGHLFSLRVAYATGVMKGQNWRRNAGWLKNHAYNGRNDPAADYRQTNYPYVWYNHRTVFHDAALQGIIHLNNINFYKENPRWGLYALAGFGGSFYKTSVNALDAEGRIYDFSGIVDAREISQRRQAIKELKELMDDTYETPAEGHIDEEKVGKFLFNPALMAGFAIGYKVNRRIELVLEERLTWTNDDLLDGHRWEETLTLTRDFDTYHYASLGINFRLGKGEESFWWSNPLNQPYEQLQETKDKVDLFTGDADGDGVADLFDQEPDTPEGAPVDSHGVTLDTDKDGVPDYKDKEPYSPIGMPVNKDGVTLDDDKDGVPNGIDLEPNTPDGALVDNQGREIVIPVGGGGAPTEILLPMIHFDLDRDEIKKDFYPQMYYVGQLMRNHPEMLILITGHTDVRQTEKYNIELSLRRAENAKAFLVENFGIDPNRFNIEYRGEENNLIMGLPDNYNPKFEDKHYLNRRVEFKIVEKK